MRSVNKDFEYQYKKSNKYFTSSIKNYDNDVLNQTDKIMTSYITALSNDHIDEAINLIDNRQITNNIKESNFLEVAIILDKLDCVKKIIQLPHFNIHRNQLLAVACLYNFIDIIEELLKIPDIDVNKCGGYNNNTPLTFVIANNNQLIFSKLIKFLDLDTNIKDSQYMLPILRTFNNNQLEMCNDIINHQMTNLGMDYAKDNNNNNILTLLSKSNKMKLVNDILMSENFQIGNSRNEIEDSLINLIGNVNVNNNIIEHLIKYININHIDHNGQTPLILSCITSHNDRISYLLHNHEINVSIIDNKNMSALMYLTKNKNDDGSLMIMNYLKNKNDLTKNIFNQKNILNENIFNMLSKHNSTSNEFLNTIPKLDYDINNLDSEGYTPLINCILNDNNELFEHLMTYEHLNINLQDINGLTPLMHTVISVDNKQMGFSCDFYKNIVMRLLYHKNLQFNLINNFGDNLLSMVIKRKYNRCYDDYSIYKLKEAYYDDKSSMFSSCFDKLLHQNINPMNANDSITWNYYIASMLLDNNSVNINHIDDDDNSILMLCCELKDINLFNKLLTRDDLNVNLINDNGLSCVHCILYQQDSKKTGELTKSTNDNQFFSDNDRQYEQKMINKCPNLTDRFSLTGLAGTTCLASKFPPYQPLPLDVNIPEQYKPKKSNINNDYFIHKLIDYPKIDLNSRDCCGYTILHLITKNKQYKLLKYLLNKDVNLNSQDCYGNTPLMYAMNTEVKYIKVLLDKGANKDIINSKNEKAENFASNDTMLYSYQNLANNDNKNNKGWFS